MYIRYKKSPNSFLLVEALRLTRVRTKLNALLKRYNARPSKLVLPYLWNLGFALHLHRPTLCIINYYKKLNSPNILLAQFDECHIEVQNRGISRYFNERGGKALYGRGEKKLKTGSATRPANQPSQPPGANAHFFPAYFSTNSRSRFTDNESRSSSSLSRLRNIS